MVLIEKQHFIMHRNKNKYVFICTLVIITVLAAIGCSPSVTVPERYLDAPSGLQVYNHAHGHTIEFYHYNTEEYFKAYRIYIGTDRSVNRYSATLIKTINRSSIDFTTTVDIPISVFIPTNSILPIPGRLYYYRVYAYGIDTVTDNNDELFSQPTQPVAGITRLEGRMTLKNQNIAGQGNDGFKMSVSGLQLIDAPDGIIDTNYSGTVFFELQDTSPYLPLLSVSGNGAGICNLGSYKNKKDINEAPAVSDATYVRFGSIIAALGNVYGVYDASSGLYGKLYITQASSGTTATNDRDIEFDWVLQTNALASRIY